MNNAETWTNTRALEKRIDGIYTQLLRKALDVSWQQHMTNEEHYGKIPSAMHQLRERRLTSAGHCYRCEDQPVKYLVCGRVELEGCSEDKPTAWRTSSSCCAIRVVRRLTNFNGWWKIGLSGQEYHIQLQAPNDWEVSRKWMDGLNDYKICDIIVYLLYN